MVGTVEESAFLQEPSGAEREVDILLTKHVYGVQIRIAVECRDRSAVDDITWIDGLIGKYRDLPVNKIVAVSATGFSAAALQKSATAGIEALTCKEALEADWPAELVKLQIGLVNRTDHPVGIGFSILEFSEPVPRNAEYDPSLAECLDSNLKAIGSLIDVARSHYDKHLVEINERLIEVLPKNGCELEALTEQKLLWNLEFRLSEIVFVRLDGELKEIYSMSIHLESTFTENSLDMNYRTFGETRISIGKSGSRVSGDPFQILVLQEPSKSSKITLGLQQLASTKNERHGVDKI